MFHGFIYLAEHSAVSLSSMSADADSVHHYVQLFIVRNHSHFEKVAVLTP